MSKASRDANPGRIGDVRVKGRTIDPSAAKSVVKVVEVEGQTPRVYMAAKKGQKKPWRGGGKKKKPGPAAVGMLKATVTTDRKWDFSRVSGLLPISREGLLEAASFRDAVEYGIKELFAGVRPGIVTWKRAQTAVLHYLRMVMCLEKLKTDKKLNFEQSQVCWKAACDASERCDDVLAKIGLDRLSEMPEAIDPWMVAPEPPEQLPADALAPPDDSGEEMEHTEPLTAAEIVEGDGDPLMSPSEKASPERD